jgi:hypothetical protein
MFYDKRSLSTQGKIEENKREERDQHFCSAMSWGRGGALRRILRLHVFEMCL